MMSQNILLLSALSHKKSSRTPIWFMRQAGRYLPEYQKLRKQQPDFIKFCLNPSLTVEAALQPLRRYDLDAAIVFSDILMLPFGIKHPIRFEEKGGPLLDPLDLKAFSFSKKLESFEERLNPIYESISLLKGKIPSQAALIGFAGGPWTIASYMLEGKLTRDLRKIKTEAYNSPELFERFLDFLVDITIHHLSLQIKAGVNVVQIFETWAGFIPSIFFEKWLINPHKKVIQTLKYSFPHVPVISFCKGLGEKSSMYVKEVCPAGFSFDETVSFSRAKKMSCSLQGNLDPLLLFQETPILYQIAKSLLITFKDKPYIFNLSHGLLPGTNPEVLKKLVDFIRQQEVLLHLDKKLI